MSARLRAWYAGGRSEPSSGGRQADMATRSPHSRQPVSEGTDRISLLWPRGSSRDASAGPALPADAAADLQVSELTRALAGGGGRPAPRGQRVGVGGGALNGFCARPPGGARP